MKSFLDKILHNNPKVRPQPADSGAQLKSADSGTQPGPGNSESDSSLKPADSESQVAEPAGKVSKEAPRNVLHRISDKISRRSVLIAALITAVLLTAAVIVLCVCLFMRADDYSAEARLLDRTVIEASSIAETLKSTHGDLSKASQLMSSHSQTEVTENSLTLYYDSELNPSTQATHAYRAVAAKTSSGAAFQYTLVFYYGDTDDEIYTLSFSSF